MRILQLIDSLDAGGAERMAVSYANALTKKVSFSGLIATRKEGLLKSTLLSDVNYLFLNKKSVLDFQAILRLFSFVKEHKISHIQAHSSSFFLAVLIKILKPSLKIIWHDHYGQSEFLNQRPKKVLQICSFFFHVIIAVNDKLKQWSENELFCKKVVYLPNFPVLEGDDQKTNLKGEKGKRILLLANLRVQKDISFLLKIAFEIKKKHPDWTFHVVGKRFKDAYEEKILSQLNDLFLNKTVYFYDSCSDIKYVLSQVQIGILTSKSEGLPVSILEYGLMHLPVVSTSVGQISDIITSNENGFLTAVNDLSAFVNSLEKLIEDNKLRITFGAQLNETIHLKFSSEAVLRNYLDSI